MSPPLSSEVPSKQQKSFEDVKYDLLYWPGIPGRGEHIRLAFEEAGADYTDTAHDKDGLREMLNLIGDDDLGSNTSAPIMAPPILRHGDLIISQTSNILLYLGPRLGLVPSEDDDANGVYQVNGLTLTALDLGCNEVHDCHHPIGTALYYEDQKEESVRKSREYVTKRLPKFLGYFERVLRSEASGAGPWLYGNRLTYADLVLFQCLDGLKHAFPRAMKKMQNSKDYSGVFLLCDAVQARPRIKAYLESERRQPYSNGIYRYYEELDVID